MLYERENEYTEGGRGILLQRIGGRKEWRRVL
jgi:hypothetical protein